MENNEPKSIKDLSEDDLQSAGIMMDVVSDARTVLNRVAGTILKVSQTLTAEELLQLTHEFTGISHSAAMILMYAEMTVEEGAGKTKTPTKADRRSTKKKNKETKKKLNKMDKDMNNKAEEAE